MTDSTEFLLKIVLIAIAFLGFGMLQVVIYRFFFKSARLLLRSMIVSAIINAGALFFLNLSLFGPEVGIVNVVASVAAAGFPGIFHIEKIIHMTDNETKLTILNSIEGRRKENMNYGQKQEIKA